MENTIRSIYGNSNSLEIRRFLKYVSYGFLIVWFGVLSSCTVGLHGRDYDDHNRYYQLQGEYYGERPYRNRLERHGYEREYRRWHRLHDNNHDNDDDDIIIER